MNAARIAALIMFSLGLASCGKPADVPVAADVPVEKSGPSMGEISKEYLFLELSMGNIDAGHVDAYFGPKSIKTRADEAALSLDQIREQAMALSASLSDMHTSDALLMSRINGLQARLTALDARIAINKGDFVPFDEETKLLFGTTAPNYGTEHFDAILSDIDAFLPGEDSLSSRVEEFRRQFIVPPEKLSAVFEESIAECRRRTREHIDLPDNESFTVEYVSDKPWTGYNWYQGKAISLIQVNTDLPIHISRAVDLGCHEGYPGHHVFNALLEKNLVGTQGWLEYTLYPLFSPQSVIAEGSGNYGVKLAFPGNERVEYEKAVLFPLAGLDASEADRFYELEDLLNQLNFAGNEAARGYLDGQLTREQAAEWLTEYGMMDPERAEQRTRFMDTYRSYVINYNHGLVLVGDYVERDTTTSAERWMKFEKMLSTSVLPSDLQD